MKKYLDTICEIKNGFNEINDLISDLDFEDSQKATFQKYDVILEEAKNDLEAKRYFICALGSVKAGKSTLINALCQHDVCIDAPGKETTKLPSIIKSVRNKSEEGIYFYQFDSGNGDKTSDNNDQEKHLSKEQETQLSKLMSAMIQDTDCREISGIKQSVRYPLCKENLMRLTTDSSGVDDCPNPFLAEINFCPTGNFFLTCKDDTPVAIIDMPGLDGITAGMKRNPAIELIASRCPRLFLVQSSMSATNLTCLNAFNALKSKHRNVHISVIFNKVEAMEWHTKDAQKEHFESVSANVKKELEKVGIHIDWFSEVNLYKAKDSSGKNERKWNDGVEADRLQDESGIKKLIDHVKTLDPNDMRIDRARDSIEGLYTHFDEHFCGVKESLEEKKQNFNKEKDHANQQLEYLKQVKDKDFTSSLSIDLSEKLEKTWDNAWNSEHEILNKIKQALESASKRRKDDTKKLCEKTRTELINSKNTLSVSSPRVAETLINCVKEVLRERFREELNGKIDEEYLGRELFDEALNGKIKNFVTDITKTAPDISAYCEKLPNQMKQLCDDVRSKIPLFAKKYDLEYFKNFIDGYSEDVKSHIEDAQKDERGQKMFDFYQHMFDGSGIVKDLNEKIISNINSSKKCDNIIHAIDKLKRQASKLKADVNQ